MITYVYLTPICIPHKVVPASANATLYCFMPSPILSLFMSLLFRP